MAKRKRVTTQKQIEKRLDEGRGLGELDKYKPWLKIQDVGSKGLSTRILGWKTNRIHHLLSKLELSFFYILEWSKYVVDIREQFPLDLEETKAIADELAIIHPTDPKSKESVVMTTDFLVTVRQPINNYLKARTLKYSKDLNNRRTLEKFEIERTYWQNRNIDWGIVTERDICPITVENIKLLHSYRNKDTLPAEVNSDILKSIYAIIYQHYENKSITLTEITKHCAEELSFSHNAMLTTFYHLLANNYFEIDISSPLNPRKKIHLSGGKSL